MSILKRNNVHVSGSGTTPMIFAHGYGCDQNMWRYLTPAFEKSHKIVVFDYVGSGDSDISAFDRSRYATLHGYAQDVNEICDELGLTNAVFVGHSVSSMIGLLASLHEPKHFSHLVLVGPSPCYLNDGDYHGGFDRSQIEELLDLLDSNPAGWSAMMAPLIMGNPERPELAQELNRSFCRTNPLVAQHFARVTFLSDNRADLSKANTPAIILQCQNDAIAPLHVGEYVHRNLKGSELIALEATGHCPHLSAPCEVSTAIEDFLNRVPG